MKGMKKMEDIIFIGMDIPKELEKEMKRKERLNTINMNSKELMSYQLGVDIALSHLKLLVSSSDYFTVHIGKQKKSELTMKELSDIYLIRMLNYSE
jgi:hypothetical protein